MDDEEGRAIFTFNNECEVSKKTDGRVNKEI